MEPGEQPRDPFHIPAGAGDASSVDPSSVEGWERVGPPRDAVDSGGYDDYDDCAVFHPSRHEGLPPGEISTVYPHRDSPNVADMEDADPLGHRDVGLISCSSARRLIESGLELMQSNGLVRVKEGVFWSFAAAAGLATALIYLRRRRRRQWREMELLLSLIQEKDHRICDLLQQVALLKEIIAMRYDIPILRKLDSPQ